MIYAHSPQIDYIAHKTCKTIYYNKEKTLQIRLLYPFVEDSLQKKVVTRYVIQEYLDSLEPSELLYFLNYETRKYTKDVIDDQVGVETENEIANDNI